MPVFVKFIRFVFIVALMFVVLVVSQLPDNNLHIVSCDVGQGDATLIIYKSTQIVIDGGLPNGKLDTCLASYVPFWDRTIELIVVTHPQLDHFGGLIHVLTSHRVEKVLISGLENSTIEYQVLKNTIGVSGAQIITPENTSTIGYGLLQLDILWPEQGFVTDNSQPVITSDTSLKLGNVVSDRDLNDFSIVLMVSLGEFDCLMTGDIGPAISDIVAKKIDADFPNPVECIKTPHHGSKNGMSQKLLSSLDLSIATISVGKDNQFGHPHKQILDMFSEAGVKIYRTDELGSIEIVSDGERYWIDGEKQ